MKNRMIVLCLVATCCSGAIACVSGTYQRVYSPPPAAPAPAPAPGAQDEPFYSDLAPYGDWVYVSGPGWVWSPYNMPADWRPYQQGHWVLTDYGWTWASDEEFGWAVYHYGRWHNDGAYGWVWVPGTEWGPAWVAWHEGGGYVGWAPLPWQVTWQAGIGLDWSGVNVNIALGPSSWYFVPARAMVDPGCRRYIVPAAQNVTLIQHTSNVTNYTYVDNRIVNQSVRVETIGRAVGHPVQRYHLEQADSPETGHGGKVQGDSFIVFRPDPGRGAHSQRRPVPPGHDDTRPASEHHGPDNPWGNPHGRDHQSHGMSQEPAPASAPGVPPSEPPASQGEGQKTSPPPQSHRDEAHDSRFERMMNKTHDWMQHPNQPPVTPSAPDTPDGHHDNQPPGQSRGTAPGNAPAAPGDAPPAPGNALATPGNTPHADHGNGHGNGHGSAPAPPGNTPPASTGSRPAPSGPTGVSAAKPGQDKTPPGQSQGNGHRDSGNKHDKPKPPETPSDNSDKKDADKPKQNS